MTDIIDIPLRISEVMKTLNIPKNRFYDLLKEEDFPLPFTFGGSSTKFYSSKEIRQWYEKQKSKNRVPKISK